MIEVDGYTALQPCECQVIRKTQESIQKSGLSKLMMEYTLETFKVKNQWQHTIKGKAIEYIQQDRKGWFYIGGQVGVGKTHICTAIVNQLIQQGNTARYMLWRDEIVKLKAIVMDEMLYQRQIQQWKSASVLYVDDLFKSEKGKPPTTADIQIAFEIINYRYNNKELMTLFSSEKLISELLEIDEAIGSRIVQMAKHYIIEIRKDKQKNMRLNQERL